MFNVNENHKFYLFKFSEKYDGLIGVDFIKQIKANINIDQKLFSTPCAQIKIIYESEELTEFKNKLKSNNHVIIIPSRTDQVCKNPVNIENGRDLLNHISFAKNVEPRAIVNFAKNVESPRAIVNIKKNFFVYTVITNADERVVEMKLHTPYEIESLNISEINFMEKMETDQNFDQNLDNILKSNLKNIRLDHCNSEEKNALSRVQINILENESVIANPGDIDTVTLETLRNMAENVLQPINNESENNHNNPNPQITQNLQQKSDKINIISDILIPPAPRQSDDTQHSTANETTNTGIKILDEMINNKVNQILIFPWPHHKLHISQENYQHHKIITLKIPEQNNEKLIFEFLRDYTLLGKTYCIYFHTNQLYIAFNNVYLEKFSEKGPKLIKCTKLNNTIKDLEEQIMLIKNHHEGKSNHRGITETIEYLKRNYYWIGLKDTVTNFINACDTCNRAKYARKKPYSPLVLTETASKPFSIVHIDIFTFDGQNYLTLVDAFSKLAQAYQIEGKTAIHVSKALIKYFTTYGVPDRFIIDNGGEFNNDAVKEILSLHKINIHFTTPYHHDSNGIVERFHSSIIEHLRILLETHPNDKENIMDYAIIAYNNTIHTVTKYTPFELTFGHTNARDPNEIFIPQTFYSDYAENHKQKLSGVYEKVNQNINTQKEKLVLRHNTQGDNSNEFKIGQTVFKQNPQTRNKKHNKFVGPYEITKILDNNKVEIFSKNKKNKIETIHIKELRKPNIVAGSSSSTQQP